jgi:hypothetical protein
MPGGGFLIIYMATPGKLLPIKPNPKIKPGAEFVTANPWFTTEPRALPPLDSIARDEIRFETIEQMLHDPDVYAGLMLLCLMALNEKLLITPAIKPQVQEPAVSPDVMPAPATPADKQNQNVQPPNQNAQPADNVPPGAEQTATQPQKVDARAQRAQDIADFCQRQVTRVQQFNTAMFQLIFYGLSFGNKVAEQILEVALRGTDAGKWCLKDIKPKPRECLAFVVDNFNNVLGFLGATAGQMSTVPFNTIVDINDVIPREKFVVFTYRPKDNDPRGQSHLDAAENGWTLKKRAWPEYLLFMMVCAIPGILATLKDDVGEQTVYEDDGVTPKRDADGEVIKISGYQFLMNMLSKMRNHQVGVAPDGTQFTLLEANTDGEVFGKFFQVVKKEIGMAILHQELATRDAEHQTKGSTTTQFTVIDLLVFWIRDIAAGMVRYDIFKPLVRYNFGDDDADELLPECSYGDTEARNWAQDATAASSLAEKLTESQWDFVTKQLGIPMPTDAERSLRRAAKLMMQQLSANGGNNNNQQAGDKKPDNNNDNKAPAPAGGNNQKQGGGN